MKLFLSFLFVVVVSVVNASADAGRWFVYDLRSDYSGSIEQTSSRKLPGKYNVEVDNGAVSSDGLLNGNLTAAVPDERTRKLGFFGFLDNKKEWDFRYLSLNRARPWFYGKGRVVAEQETITVAAGTFVVDRIERTIDGLYDNITVYWYSHDKGAIVKFHHRLTKPDGMLVREIYYELADYGLKATNGN